MTTTQAKEKEPVSTEEIMKNFDRRMRSQGESGDEDLGLLALEIIMYDPELAKKLVRAGVQKVMRDSPTASG